MHCLFLMIFIQQKWNHVQAARVCVCLFLIMQSFQFVYGSPAPGQRHIQDPITRREQICRAFWRWLTNLWCDVTEWWEVSGFAIWHLGCWIRSPHWLYFLLLCLSLLSGIFDEMQSALSSPGLDSPNSSADITLDTTGELTVEDVKDFLVWVLGLQTSWQILPYVITLYGIVLVVFHFSTCPSEDWVPHAVSDPRLCAFVQECGWGWE